MLSVWVRACMLNHIAHTELYSCPTPGEDYYWSTSIGDENVDRERSILRFVYYSQTTHLAILGATFLTSSIKVRSRLVYFGFAPS